MFRVRHNAICPNSRRYSEPAAGQPGKEILDPVATVSIGGLVTGTLAEFFVRPALFWLVGRNAAAAILRNRLHPVL